MLGIHVAVLLALSVLTPDAGFDHCAVTLRDDTHGRTAAVCVRTMAETSGRWETAAEWLEAALARYPQSGWLALQIAEVKARLRTADALGWYTVAVDKLVAASDHRGEVEARVGLGVALYRAGRAADASSEAPRVLAAAKKTGESGAHRPRSRLRGLARPSDRREAGPRPALSLRSRVARLSRRTCTRNGCGCCSASGICRSISAATTSRCRTSLASSSSRANTATRRWWRLAPRTCSRRGASRWSCGPMRRGSPSSPTKRAASRRLPTPCRMPIFRRSRIVRWPICWRPGQPRGTKRAGTTGSR